MVSHNDDYLQHKTNTEYVAYLDKLKEKQEYIRLINAFVVSADSGMPFFASLDEFDGGHAVITIVAPTTDEAESAFAKLTKPAAIGLVEQAVNRLKSENPHP